MKRERQRQRQGKTEKNKEYMSKDGITDIGKEWKSTKSSQDNSVGF